MDGKKKGTLEVSGPVANDEKKLELFVRDSELAKDLAHLKNAVVVKGKLINFVAEKQIKPEKKETQSF